MAYKKFKNVKTGDTLYVANVSNKSSKINIEAIPVESNAEEDVDNFVSMQVDGGKVFKIQGDAHVIFGDTIDDETMCVSTSKKACYTEAKTYKALQYAQEMNAIRAEFSKAKEEQRRLENADNENH